MLLACLQPHHVHTPSVSAEQTQSHIPYSLVNQIEISMLQPFHILGMPIGVLKDILRSLQNFKANLYFNGFFFKGLLRHF
jgi:hypothetical protein